MIFSKFTGWPLPPRTDGCNRADFGNAISVAYRLANGAVSVDENAQAVARNGCRLARHGPAQVLTLKSGGQVAVAAGKKASKEIHDPSPCSQDRPSRTHVGLPQGQHLLSIANCLLEAAISAPHLVEVLTRRQLADHDPRRELRRGNCIEWQVGTRVHIKKIEKLKGAIGERDCLARANTGEDCFWTSIIWEKNR